MSNSTRASFERLRMTVPDMNFAELDAPAERAYLERIRAIAPGSGLPEMPVEDRIVGDGTPARVYRPDDGLQDGVIHYVHGGGWVMGNLDLHDGTCRMLAQRTRRTVVATTYRLAPEHPYPAAALDTFAALEWIAAAGRTEGWDGTRIVMAGSSAGGNLVASSTLRAKSAYGPAISLQVLIYPVIDSSMTSESYRSNGVGYLTTADHMAWYWDKYAPERSMRTDPFVSPMHAPDLSGLPPALIVTAEFDPLRDEGEAYGERLRNAGVPVKVFRANEMIHGFMNFGAFFPEAQTYLALIADHISAHLAAPSGR